MIKFQELPQKTRIAIKEAESEELQNAFHNGYLINVVHGVDSITGNIYGSRDYPNGFPVKFYDYNLSFYPNGRIVVKVKHQCYHIVDTNGGIV